MWNPIFRSKILQKQFERNGYVIVPFVTPIQLQKLNELFHSYCPQPSHEVNAIFYSLFANDTTRNRELRNKIRAIWLESYERVFSNYQSFAESFLAKAKTDEQLMLHQDWNYSEEDQFFSATVWCPLADSTAESGTLFVLPGSHHFFRVFRSGTLPTARLRADERLQPFIVPVNIKAGEAVVFQQGLFHGSYPNKSGKLRIIAASVILEKNKPATYYQKASAGQVDLYEMNDDVFFAELKNLVAGEKPLSAAFNRNISYHHHQITTEDILQKLRDVNALAFFK